MKEETKVWLEIVEEDYKDMNVMLKAHRYRGAVFFAQQAVEKIIKAWIVEYKNCIPRKTHNIALLIKDAGFNKSEIEDLDVDELTLAYTRVRYTDLSRQYYNTKEKAEKVLKIAQETYLWIKNKFKNN